MRKITLLSILMAVPFFGLAQGPWEFTGTEDGWSRGGGCTAATGATAWTLTTNGGNNPNFTNESAGVDADANTVAAVTLRLSAGGPTYLRLRIQKDDLSGFVYKTVVLDPTQTDFVTYYIDATDSNWSGTENNIRFQFKDNDGTNSGTNHSTTGETIEIDTVEFLPSIPATVQNTYTFDSSEEGWDDTIRCSVAANNGNLEVQLAGTGTPGDTNNSKVALNSLYVIDATGNPYLHITLKNNTNDDQLKIVYPDGMGGNVTVTQTISTNDTDFVTYDFNLGSNPAWTGEKAGVELVFDDTVGQEGNGLFEIDSIVVDNILSTSDNSISSFSVSPNPADTFIYINVLNGVINAEIFDITGKKVLETNRLIDNKLDISQLRSGVYLLRVTDETSNKAVKRIIKQ
ncbi:hypothetical protein BWZ20_07880 [Winogradskyella sp. J14-2]|uniref:T9SS type A sorting domain-containing protein n=1 Tax=Winogradskyella sp. J14-2 TaxID=1936080 RepID=UPI0009729FDB|nr:T9SS type A sorting domain-containing protein [Winogradskyella sp. J14-2]APY08225.1 hypothetical protein BWZ20_07880 [Winogradskyella sp. J14-2]